MHAERILHDPRRLCKDMRRWNGQTSKSAAASAQPEQGETMIGNIAPLQERFAHPGSGPRAELPSLLNSTSPIATCTACAQVTIREVQAARPSYGIDCLVCSSEDWYLQCTTKVLEVGLFVIFRSSLEQ